MKYNKIFISDIHLGTRASQTKLLKKFLENVSFDELYLVGDIVDLWAMKKKIFWDKKHNEIVRLFLKISKNHRIKYILGNHDESIRKFIPLDFGNIEICNKDSFIYNGKRFYILHGDQFDFIVNKFPVLAWLGTWLYDVIIYLNIVFSWVREKLGFPYWSLSKYLKDKAKSSFGLLEKYKLYLENFCFNKNIEIVIFGHLHMPQLYKKKNLIVANTGDWVENCTAIGLVNDEIHLLTYDRLKENWDIKNREFLSSNTN